MKLPRTSAAACLGDAGASYGLAGPYVTQPAAALYPAVAADPSCDGIAAAFPILGKGCATQYAKIDHDLGAGASCKALTATYMARIATMVAFRKALLCNGMMGASKVQQDAFKAGEAGHIEAAENLRQRLVDKGCTIPFKGAEVTDLVKAVSVRKQQCK